jgi:hypothetical protein
MLLPNADHPEVAEQAHLSKESLLNLTGLLKQWSGSGNSDNLLEPSSDGCKEGHHAAAITLGHKPNRRGVRTSVITSNPAIRYHLKTGQRK